jgi:hypothetical protein
MARKQSSFGSDKPVSSKRVDEPVITINAMVKVGRWTIGPVYYGRWRRCDRCQTEHKYVYVCTVDDDVDDQTVAEQLFNHRVWRVGSTCGPTLDRVSSDEWGGPPAELAKIVRLAVSATHVLERAAREGYDSYHLPLIAGKLEPLKGGQLTPHELKVFGSHVSRVKTALDSRKRRREEGRVDEDD